MGSKRFQTFGEASAFAKRTATSSSQTVEISRSGDEWVVLFTRSSFRPRSMKNSVGDDLHRSDREIQETPKDAESERLFLKRNRENLEDRQAYLEQREDYYRKMDDERLDKEWAARDENLIEIDEVGLLRDLVRERKGIKPSYGTSIRVCGSCGEVGDNCTCGRSWF